MTFAKGVFYIMLHLQHLIGGKWVQGKLFSTKINPSNEEIISDFPLAHMGIVDETIDTAIAAQKSWRQLSRIKRAEYFDRLCEIMKSQKDKFVNAISLETGKSKNESAAEFVEALHMAQYTFGMARMPNGSVVPSEIAERDSYIIRKPKGIVAVISPWNFPMAIGGFWCAAPALLEGNAVIWKPSEDTPYTAQLVAELYTQAGFPPGVFNLLFGLGWTGELLACHPKINHICFTGSRAIGNKIQIWCAQNGTKSFSCETGSKSAVMVFDDADFDLAVNAAIASAYKLSGQRCVSAGRILVQEGVCERFQNRFVELSSRLTIGDPFLGDYYCGPLINEHQIKSVLAYNAMTTEGGSSTILMHGSRIDGKGYFLTPHVYHTPWSEAKFLHEEVFGPHVAIVPFKDLDEAIAIYNDTEYGLALGVITSDFKKAREVRERCEFGLGYWNSGSIAAESHLPFGGIRGSGAGGASAAATFDAVVHKVTWSVNHGTLQFPQGLL